MKLGLLGKHLSHSYSPILHKLLMEEKGIIGTYSLFEISKEELPLYVNKIRNKELDGLNVTIPYKKDIMPYLDKIDEAAKKIGAVNTVYLKDGLACGTNTDYYGFKDTLRINNINVNNKVCYVLGTGGASLAVEHVILDLGGKVIKVSRNPLKGMISYQELNQVEKPYLIVNTTPVGMYPNIDESPINKDVARRSEHVIDIIFNPKTTKLLSYVDNKINGLWMLMAQGEKSEQIWFNKDYKLDLKDIFNKFKEMI